jgi:hypothetical protein
MASIADWSAVWSAAGEVAAVSFEFVVINVPVEGK